MVFDTAHLAKRHDIRKYIHIIPTNLSGLQEDGHQPFVKEVPCSIEGAGVSVSFQLDEKARKDVTP